MAVEKTWLVYLLAVLWGSGNNVHVGVLKNAERVGMRDTKNSPVLRCTKIVETWWILLATS